MSTHKTGDCGSDHSKREFCRSLSCKRCPAERKRIEDLAANYARVPSVENLTVDLKTSEVEALKAIFSPALDREAQGLALDQCGDPANSGDSLRAARDLSTEESRKKGAELMESLKSEIVKLKEAKRKRAQQEDEPRTVERWIAEVTAEETEHEKEEYGRDAYGSLLGWLAQLHEAGEDAAKVFRASVQAARRVIAFAGYRTRPECWDRLRDYEGQERNSAQRRVSHQARVALALRAGSGTEPQEAALVALGRYWLDVGATQAVKERASKEAQEVTRFVAWCKGLRVLYGPGTRAEVRDLAALCLFRFGSLGSDGWAAELAVILLALHPQARAALDKVRPHGTPEIPARIGDKIRFVRVLADGIDPLVSASDLDAHRPVLVALAYLYRYCNPLPA